MLIRMKWISISKISDGHKLVISTSFAFVIKTFTREERMYYRASNKHGQARFVQVQPINYWVQCSGKTKHTGTRST